MKNNILKIVLGIIMLVFLLGGIILILADEIPGKPIDLLNFIIIKASGFLLFYFGTLIYKKVKWTN